MPRGKTFSSGLNDTVAWLEASQIPVILRIGCCHPRNYEVTRLMDGHARHLCGNINCRLEWFDLERR